MEELYRYLTQYTITNMGEKILKDNASTSSIPDKDKRFIFDMLLLANTSDGPSSQRDRMLEIIKKIMWTQDLGNIGRGYNWSYTESGFDGGSIEGVYTSDGNNYTPIDEYIYRIDPPNLTSNNRTPKICTDRDNKVVKTFEVNDPAWSTGEVPGCPEGSNVRQNFKRGLYVQCS